MEATSCEKPHLTKEEIKEMINKKRESKRAEREAKKAARREELAKTTVEITNEEFIAFKEWKRSQKKIRVNKEEYEAFLAEKSKTK